MILFVSNQKPELKVNFKKNEKYSKLYNLEYLTFRGQKLRTKNVVFRDFSKLVPSLWHLSV